MNDEIDPLYDMLPPDQIERVMMKQDCDIDATFLGFIEVYRAIASIIPLHWTVIDFGCAYAQQAFLFTNHKQYVGVDFHVRERFEAPNTVHFTGNIIDFCQKQADHFDISTSFAICSYVPNWGGDNIAEVKKTFRNVFTYYPAGTRDFS